jgi:hypothetical protein
LAASLLLPPSRALGATHRRARRADHAARGARGSCARKGGPAPAATSRLRSTGVAAMRAGGGLVGKRRVHSGGRSPRRETRPDAAPARCASRPPARFRGASCSRRWQGGRVRRRASPRRGRCPRSRHGPAGRSSSAFPRLLEVLAGRAFPGGTRAASSPGEPAPPASAAGHPSPAAVRQSTHASRRKG